MRTLVRFKVLNRVQTDQPWPVKLDNRTFVFESEGKTLQAIVCSIEGQPAEFAPIFKKGKEGGMPTIDANSLWVKFVEDDLKAWQAVLCAYIEIDIDFQNYEMEFFPENDEEKKLDILTPFRISQIEHVNTEPYEFTTLGRALFALEHGRQLASVMTFYREGKTDLFGNRFVSSYNNLYLFLESLFCKGKTKTAHVVENLLAAPPFVEALVSAIQMTKNELPIPRASDRIRHFPKELKIHSTPKVLTESIVNLRGKLRHHNENSSVKWDPTRQDDYRNDAYFLAAVVQNIAFQMGAQHLWENSIAKGFQEMSKSIGVELKIRVKMELIAGELTFERLVDLTVPAIDLNARLATFVLNKALELADQNDPHAGVLTIRAHQLPNGPELFRYDLGAQVARGKS